MAIRPEFKPRFAESATAIRERMLSNIPDDWRKEDGDFMYDAIGANPPEVMQLEMQQDRVLQNAFPQYCEDDFLDLHLQLRGLKRIGATKNVRIVRVEADPGVRIDKGYRLTSIVLDLNGNPIEFIANEETTFTESDTIVDIRVTCVATGTSGNLSTGAEFVLQPPIPGIRGLTDMGTVIPANDKEGANAAWTRYLEKVYFPDTGGNKNDYRRWVLESIPAVEKVIVQPLWNGNGTIRLVCVGADYNPCSAEVIGMVQTYVDPIPFQAQGEGKAPIGAFVTVITGTAKPVEITANITYKTVVDTSAILLEFKHRVTEYLHSIVFEVDPKTEALYPVAYNKIGSILITIEGVENYASLLLNGDTEDLALVPFDIPTLGAVVLT